MSVYVVKSLIKEIALTCVIVMVANISNFTLLCDGLDLAGFIGALFDFNIAIVFSLFVAIFLSSDNPALKDARSHSAYVQPVIITVVNSFLLCVVRLNKFTGECDLTDIFALAWIVVAVLANIRYSWKVFCICRVGWRS